MEIKETNKFMQTAVVAAILTCLLFSSAVAHAQSGLIYITNNGAITITGYNPMEVTLAIPDFINGYKVTGIGDYAFASSSLGNLTLGSNLTSIGRDVFQNCINLQTISIDSNNPYFSSLGGILYSKDGSTIVAFPASAFDSLQMHGFTTNVTSIGDFAYQGCRFTSLTIPSIITNIGMGAFENVQFIPSIVIPSNVVSLGDGVFAGCRGLSTISVDPLNQYYSSSNGILFDISGGTLIAYPASISGTSYTVSSGVSSIASDAFYGAQNLTNVNLPTNVVGLGSNVFYNAPKLANVTIPASVTNIGSESFSYCASLSAIIVDPQNAFYSSSNGVLFDKNYSTLIAYPAGSSTGVYTIPNSVSNIDDYAFFHCIHLTSVTIPNSVNNLGNYAFSFCGPLRSIVISTNITCIPSYAFWECGSLTSVKIPDSVTNVSDYAFADCSSLANISWGSNIQSIGSDAFSFCLRLTNLVLPSNVEYIGAYAFANCQGLTNIYFEGNAPFADTNALDNPNNTTVYYLPDASGWGSTLGGVPTALWLPSILANPKQAPFGIQAGQFDFTVSWASNLSVVIQSCTNLLNSSWSPVATNVLTNGIWQFSDAASTNYSPKFYRVSAQ